MKKSVAALIFTASLWAADFWQARPFNEWSDKETHRMIENSPWAKEFNITSAPAPSGGRGGKRGSPMNDTSSASLGDSTSPGPSDPGARNRNGDDTFGDLRNGPLPPTLIIRWQTALPVKQAFVKLKYGSEAATSAEARKSLGAEDRVYAIAVSGLQPSMVQGSPERIKKDLIEHSSLSVKGKEDIRPVEIQVARGSRLVDLYFLFPRAADLSVDDKEVEFSTKIESLVIKQRFRLKDMVVKGKLLL
jgi:hypothetical protein